MLRTTSFSDIYLGQHAAWLAGIPGSKDPVKAEQDDAVELKEIREACEKYAEEHKGNDDFAEEFPVRVQDVAYRVSTLNSLSEKVFILRRQPDKVPELKNLGLHGVFVERLLTPGLTGLLLFSGAYSQGKTTSASATLHARVSEHGGVAITIEDPPEHPLEGVHGNGVIYQTWVNRGGFSEACRRAARWAPSIIFLSEIRDAETAAEALRASINGRLVIATTHADNVQSAVERVYSLACSAGGTADDWASLLSSGLAGVIHQTLTKAEKSIKAQMLWLGDEKEALGPRNNIKGKRFGQLAQDVQQQMNLLAVSGGKKQ